MRTYYIIKWESNGKETPFSVEASDFIELYDKLEAEYGEEILLHGYTYNYISNFSHYLAAGFQEQALQHLTIEEAVSPAHINKDFFYILGYTENKNEEKF